jgi:cytochrome c oxidase subunit 2
MVSTIELERGDLRLLEVDNRLVLPVGCHVRFIVTGADVIHSFGVPSLGLKLDGIPGRLNQVGVCVEHSGVYRGMCSELCGVNHAYMPIVIEVVDVEDFFHWFVGVCGVES